MSAETWLDREPAEVQRDYWRREYLACAERARRRGVDCELQLAVARLEIDRLRARVAELEGRLP